MELDGQESSVRSEAKQLEQIVRSIGPLFVQRAYGSEQCEKIWQLRREFSYALRDTGLTKLNEDIVVPRGRLEDLFRFTAGLQEKHGWPVACFGHAGDGHIHVNIMVDLQEPDAKKRCDAALDELFEKVLLGGAITGEHGIGWPKAGGRGLLSPELRRLHQTVKDALDPRGILNPEVYRKPLRNGGLQPTITGNDFSGAGDNRHRHRHRHHRGDLRGRHHHHHHRHRRQTRRRVDVLRAGALH